MTYEDFLKNKIAIENASSDAQRQSAIRENA